MAITIEHLSDTKKSCRVTYSHDEFKKAYKEHFKEMKPKVRIDGFRPGKISDTVIEKKFGLSLKQEVVDKLLQNGWTKILEDYKFEPINQPIVDIKPTNNLKELTLEHDLVLDYVFEINPDFDLISLEQHHFNFTETLLDDHQIALYERHLARTLGQETVTDLPAQANDVIHFDAVFTVNGVVSEEKNVRMFLDTEESNEEFVKNLIGLKAGDEKTFSYQGVPNSFNKIVTGEHVDATVKIIEVSTLIPADRTTLKQAQKDEQQEDHEAIMTDEAFDEKLRTDAALLLEQRDFLHNKELFLKTLAEAYNFEIPEAYLSKIEHLSAQDKDKAIKEMRLDLVLNKHMALLKPTVTEKSVEKAIFELMMDKDVPPQLVHNALKNNKNFRESFYHNLLIDDLIRKAIHFIKNPHDEVLTAETKQPHKHHAGCGHDHAHDEHHDH